MTGSELISVILLLMLTSLQHQFTLLLLQILYKEAVKQELPCPLYHKLPDTPETQLARELAELQSQVTGYRSTE